MPVMRILILGGTQFIGRQIVETLLAAGHAASILTRGKSPDELPVEVERLRGDRDEGPRGLEALRGRSWDACIDVSGYTPRQVRPSAELLRAKVKRYVFVSSNSVYGDPRQRPVIETFPRVPPAGEDVTEIDAESYGQLKVACEDIVQEIYADRCTLLRPQIIVGENDPRSRYAYWVERAMQGGAVLAPGDGADHLQVIDVRDVAQFARTVIEKNLCGAFNLSGPRLTWAAFMKLLGAENIVWVAAEIIRAAGVTEFDLPLFRREGGPRSSLMDLSHERARAAGLTLTDPEITIRDIRAWLRGNSLTPSLSREREKELIGFAQTGLFLRTRPSPTTRPAIKSAALPGSGTAATPAGETADAPADAAAKSDEAP
jgi:2'-hydroxyisoflavone reductase